MLKRGWKECGGGDQVPSGYDEAGTVALSLDIDGRDEVHVCPSVGHDVEDVLIRSLEAIQTALAGVRRVQGA